MRIAWCLYKVIIVSGSLYGNMARDEDWLNLRKCFVKKEGNGRIIVMGSSHQAVEIRIG